jgi:hypothetical protein
MAYASRIFRTDTYHTSGPRRRACEITDASTPHCIISLFISSSMDCNIHRVNGPHCTTTIYKNSTTSMNMHTSFSHLRCGHQPSAHTQRRTSHHPLEAIQPSICASSTTSNSGPPSPMTNQTGNAGSRAALYNPARMSTLGSCPSGNVVADFRAKPYALRVSVTMAAGTAGASRTSATRTTTVPGVWQISKPLVLLPKGTPSR